MNEPTRSKILASQLKQYQALPLNAKVTLSKKRIQEWLDHWEDQCYVAFSGGKDSTVLLDLVWSINPRIPAVFVDTGLEYPEIREFVKTFGDRVVWLKPKMPFTQVIEKYGYPVVSKRVSDYIGRLQNTKSKQVVRRLTKGQNADGSPSPKSKVPDKWLSLVSAPFKCSASCCDVMKKRPIKAYSKQSGRYAGFIGTMTEESVVRKQEYINHGCNGFDLKHPLSSPLSFWTDEDIKQYFREHMIPYCHKIYGAQREQQDGSWVFEGEQRTGCMFCMFGVHLEKGTNRFQRMYHTHPKQWNYCINQLGCGKVLDYIGVKYVPEGVE